MKAEKYIKENLQLFADKFPGIVLSYGFQQRYNEHIVAVFPAGCYSDEDFTVSQINFEMDFMENFPHEALVFSPIDQVLDLHFEYVTKPVALEVFVNKEFKNSIDFDLELLAQYPVSVGFNESRKTIIAQLVKQVEPKYLGENSFECNAA